MKLLIICQLAVTSKNMVTKVTKLAQELDYEMEVQCAPVAYVRDLEFSKFDVVLVAPQARNYMRDILEKCEPLQIPVESIDVVAYGLADAKKILDQAKKVLEKGGENK